MIVIFDLPTTNKLNNLGDTYIPYDIHIHKQFFLFQRLSLSFIQISHNTLLFQI